MIAYIRNLFDRRTLDQKIADGIAKQVEEDRRQQRKVHLSHTYTSWFYEGKWRWTITDYRPEDKRKFH